MTFCRAAAGHGDHHRLPQTDAPDPSCDGPCYPACHFDFANHQAWRNRLPWKHSNSMIPFLVAKKPDTGGPPDTNCFPVRTCVKSSPAAPARIFLNISHPCQPKFVQYLSHRRNCRVSLKIPLTILHSPPFTLLTSHFSLLTSHFSRMANGEWRMATPRHTDASHFCICPFPLL